MDITPMTAEAFAGWLEQKNACDAAREWAEGKDLHTAWVTCENVDWFLCALKMAELLTPQQEAKLGAAFARRVAHLNTEPYVMAAIDAAERWADGEITEEERESAAGVASAAAGVMASKAGWVAHTAARAASVTAGVAAFAAAFADGSDGGSEQCRIIREMIPEPLSL